MIQFIILLLISKHWCHQKSNLCLIIQRNYLVQSDHESLSSEMKSDFGVLLNIKLLTTESTEAVDFYSPLVSVFLI